MMFSSSWAFAPQLIRSSRHLISDLTMTSSLIETPRSSFEDRMRNMVLGRRKEKTVAIQPKLPDNVKIVSTLGEYKKVVGGEKKSIVVVRFFAPWCKVRAGSVLFLVGRSMLFSG
jgi:hypothetical protein